MVSVCFWGITGDHSECCHLIPMQTVCLCLCWNAELVPGGHNSHTRIHRLLGVQARLHAGRGQVAL